jgi:hypothetical protein
VSSDYPRQQSHILGASLCLIAQRSKELVRKLENELGKSEGLQKARTALELEVRRPVELSGATPLLRRPFSSTDTVLLSGHTCR